MVTTRSKAQDVVLCELCSKPALKFCNSCQINLCKPCVRKHRDEFKSLSHEIVPFVDKKVELVKPECHEHSGQRCEVNCKECNKPVCIKCMLGPHKGHEAEELSKTHEIQTRKIKTDTEEIKINIIPKYQKEDAEIGNVISKTKTKHEGLDKESKKLRQLWHQEVDDIFDKVDSLSQSYRDDTMKALLEYHTKIRNIISEMKGTVQQNSKLLGSNNYSKVNEYHSKLTEYQRFPEKLELKWHPLKSNNDKGKELSIEFGKYSATLNQMPKHRLKASVSRLGTHLVQIMGDVKIIATIITYIPQYGVACVGESEAWIHGNMQIIKRYDIHGTVKGTVTTLCQFKPGDISVTKDEEMIYSDRDSNTIKIVRDGKSETLITPPQGWTPWGLCCTRSGDILVQVYKGNRSQTKNKIIRYQGQNLRQEINADEQEKSIFKEVYGSLYMSENNNGDICVSDANAGTIVVVDKKGKIRFRYDGTPARRGKTCGLRGIVTDALSQIIVADYNNNCLHILDQNGQFLRCIDNCELDKPIGLSVDNEGRLWVGLNESGKIKVIEYLQNK